MVEDMDLRRWIQHRELVAGKALDYLVVVGFQDEDGAGQSLRSSGVKA
jgi:hypothetical protein